MNILKNTTFSILLASLTVFSSCSKDEDTEQVKPDLEIKTVTDLDGSAGPLFFSFKTNAQITGADTASTSNKWDIRIASTTVGINKTAGAAAQFQNSTFENVVIAPESGYLSDDIKGSGSWYTYTGQTGTPSNAILTVPGKIWVFKTADGKYAKLEMISYYKGNPNTATPEFANFVTRPPSRFYTFRFAYQADGSRNLK